MEKLVSTLLDAIGAISDFPSYSLKDQCRWIIPVHRLTHDRHSVGEVLDSANVVLHVAHDIERGAIAIN